MYDPDDCLMISGLQHFRFCRRQWALIHIEQQWAENLRTTEGALLHERAHDEQLRERRGDTITHPYLKEKISWGLVPYVQALLLARYLRDDLDAYPPFLWK